MLRARPALRLACRLAWLAACAAACVPRGDPPAGRQIVADRTTTVVGIARSNGDGTTRVLITRPGQDGQSADLYVVSLDAAGTAPAERLLAASLPGNYYAGCGIGPRDCLGPDPRGRLFFPTGDDPNMGLVLTRIDPVTGDRLELGAGVAFYLFSASGDRLLAGQAFDNESTLYEPDGRAIPLGETRGVSFVGEDLYYLTAQQELLRIVPGGAPERLAAGVTSFSNFLTTGGDLLIVLARQQAATDPFSFTQSFLDPVTLEETPSPFGSGQFTISPDGRWLLMVDFVGSRATFVDRTTGAQDVFDLPVFQNGFAGYEWRPGHNEVWFSDNGFSDPVIWSKKPGAPAVEIHAHAYSLGYGFGQGSSYFTRDGAYWFSSRTKLSETPIIQAGSADDPAGARFDLAPAGAQSDGYLQLADGRILTAAWVGEPTRADLYALDPATGDSRVLGQAGSLIAAGQTRLLANQYVNDGRGDLTAVELATGRATVLAPEFAMSAVVERRGADPVAPGAPVAFQFRARFESPFDGIWVATIP